MATPEGRPVRPRRAALRWILSFLVAGYGVFVLHDLTVDHPPPHVFDSDLERVVLAPGYEWRRMKEGRGSSRVGKLGILGVPDAAADPRPKVLVWGDSFVEGMEVGDDERAPQVATRLANGASDREILAVGICAAGWSLADCYFQLPRYHRALPRHVLDVFVLVGLGDVRPNDPGAVRSRFVYAGDFDLVPAPPVRLGEAAAGRQALLHRLHLQYPVRLAREVVTGRALDGLRFAPGPVAPAAARDPGTDRPPEFTRRAFDFLLTRIADRATRPALVVLLPRDTPRIEDGRVVTSDAPERGEEEFREACRRAGLDFVSLRGEFNRAWRSDGALPRGFPNSIPGEGHLNAVGHRILGEAIATYLREREDAVLPD